MASLRLGSRADGNRRAASFAELPKMLAVAGGASDARPASVVGAQ
jgi:hypothetical protein